MNDWVPQTNIRGPQGIQGVPGPGIRMKGTVPTYADLPTDAAPGDMYNADDTGHSWTWDGTTWIDGGSSRGADGLPGPPNVLNIGTVSTVAPGGAATASIIGSSPAQTLNLGIPSGLKGDKGDQGIQGIQGVAGPPNSLAIGTVTTGAPGSSAAASITGTPPNQTLSLTIPRGDSGAPGVASVSTSAPASPVQGQIWWNVTTKTLSIFVGSAWEPVEAAWA